MINREKKYFAQRGENKGYLDADSAAFAVALNAWVNMENIRIGSTDKGVIETAESVGGTLRVDTFSTSNYIRLGSVADDANNRILYALYDTIGDSHIIIAYYKDTNTTYTVTFNGQVDQYPLAGGGLVFNKNYPIDMWIVGNLLYWTDNYSDPRRINIDAGIKLNNPSFNTTVAAYTSPINQKVTTIIRYAPERPPSLTFQTIPSRQNFLREFAGQFAYRNHFRDGETSVFGTPSVMVNYRFGTNPSQTNYDLINRITITLQWQNGYDIEQDVRVFELAVRYNNQPNYFIIKSWDKSNAADLAEINAYNAGGSLVFYFYNDKTGVAVDGATSVLPFHNVPLLSATGSTGLNRNFLGGNTVGYDTPKTTSITGTPLNSAPFGIGSPMFKSWSTYQLGVRFRDKYKRASGVVTDPLHSIVTIPDRGDYNNSSGFYNLIQATLSNTNALVEIPDWAYYYDVLITKNLRTRFFAQWAMRNTDVQYVIKNVDGTYTYQNNYVGGLFGIAFKTTNLTLNGMGIQFTQGDDSFIRIYLSGLSTSPFSLSVVGQDSDYIICSPVNLGTTTSIADLLLVEYYVQYKPVDEEPFYTVGGFGEVNSPTTSSRQYGTTGVNIYGDVTFFQRIFYAPTGYGYWAEGMSPNDGLWKDWLAIYGESNVATSLGQAIKETSVKWSNTFVQGSDTNGLSAFDPLDEKILPLDMGALRKLQQTSKVSQQGNVMLAIGEQQTASLYLGEVQVVGSDQNAFLASSPNVIGTVNILKGNFGTINPESVTEYRGNVYWWDMNNGRVIQYSSNGLFPISNYKMTRFCKLWSEQFLSMTSAEIEALGGRPFIYMIVDPAHDELLISLPKLSDTPPKGYLPTFNTSTDATENIIYPFDILDFQGKTLVYDIKNDRWLGGNSFNPEGFVALQNQLYSFKLGFLYLHNQFNNQCNFYGVQYKPKIMFVSNMSPSQLKSYNAMAVESNMPPSYLYMYNDYPYQQISDLADYQFTSLEGIWNAVFNRNIIQPTAIGNTTTSRLTGEKMRSVAMFFMAEFTVSGSVPLELKFIDIAFTMSLGNTNV